MLTSQIEPELQQGAIVIVDRYVDSTTAYQGYGYEGSKGRPTLDQIQAVNATATRGVMPDLTVLLDIDPEEALRRRAVQLALGDSKESQIALPRIYEEGQSKFENKGMSFHKKVREGYLRLAKREPGRWFIVDARQSMDAIEDIILERVNNGNI